MTGIAGQKNKELNRHFGKLAEMPVFIIIPVFLS